MKLRHIHDLSALRRDLQYGDLALCARLTGYPKNLLYYHLTYGGEMGQKKGKLAWRVLLAKLQSNRAFQEALRSADFTPTVDELRDSLKELISGDIRAIGQVLGRTQKDVQGSYYKFRKTLSDDRKNYIQRSGQPLARAVILRAEHNRRFLAQVEPWLKEKKHGAA